MGGGSKVKKKKKGSQKPGFNFFFFFFFFFFREERDSDDIERPSWFPFPFLCLFLLFFFFFFSFFFVTPTNSERHMAALTNPFVGEREEEEEGCEFLVKEVKKTKKQLFLVEGVAAGEVFPLSFRETSLCQI